MCEALSPLLQAQVAEAGCCPPRARCLGVVCSMSSSQPTPRRSSRAKTLAVTMASSSTLPSSSNGKGSKKNPKKGKGRQVPPPDQDDSDMDPVTRKDFRELVEQVKALAKNQAVSASEQEAQESGSEGSGSSAQGSEAGKGLKRKKSKKHKKHKKHKKSHHRARSRSRERSISPAPSSSSERRALELADALKGERSPSVASYRLLGASLDKSLKAKIWGGRFIDMCLLLDRDPSRITLEFEVNSTGMPAVKRSHGKQLAFGEWCRAFDIYMSVVGEQDPHCLPLMLKHKSLVSRLQNSGRVGAWHFYDVEYRQAVAAPNLDLDWGMFDPMLWSEASMAPPPSSASGNASDQHRRRQQQANQPKSRGITDGQTGIFVPRGFCLGFNVGRACQYTPCRFEHLCPSCRKPHPLLKCRALPSTGTAATSDARQQQSTNTIKTK